nr:MAG TPA: hypothetical protein [Caudoviricetes sp.]
MDNSIFLNFNKILSYNALLNFILSERRSWKILRF